MAAESVAESRRMLESRYAEAVESRSGAGFLNSGCITKSAL